MKRTAWIDWIVEKDTHAISCSVIHEAGL